MVLRGLLTRAMFRQALAESLAWTPMESPWTMPAGLLGAVWDLGRRASGGGSWLADGGAKHKLVGGQLDHPAQVVGYYPLGQGRCHGLGGLLRLGLEQGLAHLVHPGVVHLALAERLAQQLVLVKQLGEQRPNLALVL